MLLRNLSKTKETVFRRLPPTASWWYWTGRTCQMSWCWAWLCSQRLYLQKSCV